MASARVLFVDDEPLIREYYSLLGGILGSDYEIFAVASAREGLTFLQQTPVDIVVSDLVMPEMNGKEFMGEVARRHPESMRIVLSGYDDQLTVAQSLMFGHRYMSKPFDLKNLAAVLNRICRLKYQIGGDKVKKIVSALGALPTPPKIFQRLVKALNSEFTSLQEVADIVQEDPGLTLKLLQIANSAYFGGGRRTVTTAEAVQLVGVEILRGLALCVHAFKFYSDRKITSLSASALWEHSIETAHHAQRLAVLEELPRNRCDEAFVVGLLHDIGKLVMAANADPDYAEVMNRTQNGALPAEDAELNIFGATHAQIGAYLLGLWGLPDEVVDAVDLHHDLGGSGQTGFTPLIAVHVAQCLSRAANRLNRLNLEYLRQAGLEERVPVWQEALRN